MPKQKSSVWKDFKCVYKENNSGKWAVCKSCKKEMQGIPQRMTKHLEICGANSSMVSEEGQSNICENQENGQNKNGMLSKMCLH